MNRKLIERHLAAAIDELRGRGASWWPGEEMAPLVFRRLSTFSRRNKSRHPSADERATDLVKGLQAHFEPDLPYNHPNDWCHLATVLVSVWSEAGDDVSVEPQELTIDNDHVQSRTWGEG